MNNIYSIGEIIDTAHCRWHDEPEIYAVIDSLIAAGCELPYDDNGFPQFTGEEAQLILDQLAAH